MKIIKYSFYCMISLLIISCTSTPKKPDGGFRVSGKVKGYTDDYVYLEIDRKVVDSAKVNNGNFTLVGKLDVPKPSVFSNRDRSKVAFAYLDNAEVKMILDFSKERKEITVEGSPAHEIYKDFQDLSWEASEKYKGASRASYYEYLAGQIYYYLEAKSERINPVSLDQTYFIYRARIKTHHFPVEHTKRILDLFKDKYANEEQYKLIAKRLKAGELRVPGTPFMEYKAKDVNDKPIKLSDYYGKSYILVDLWASWCGPCRAENPHYKEAMKRFGKKGLQIFSVSFDDKKKDWVKAIKDDKIFNFIHASVLKYYDDPISNTYYISAIPDNFLLDKNGIILDNALRGEDLLETLEHLYNKK